MHPHAFMQSTRLEAERHAKIRVDETQNAVGLTAHWSRSDVRDFEWA